MRLLTRIKHTIVPLLAGRELPMARGERRRTVPDTERGRMGQIAEREAACYLLIRGYRILARGRRNTIGERDIVARKADAVVYVEVRSRRRGASVRAQDTLTREKRRKLLRTAELFAAQHGLSQMQPQIDLIAIEVDDRDEPRVSKHLENCITADGGVG